VYYSKSGIFGQTVFCGKKATKKGNTQVLPWGL
jgi:hypothetical protein